MFIKNDASDKRTWRDVTKKLVSALSAPEKMSLGVYHPLASLVIASVLAGLFLAVSIAGNLVRSHDESRDQTRLIAAIVSEDLAAGRLGKVERVLSQAGEGRLALNDPDGVLVAGEADISRRPGTITAPVVHDGRPIATLSSHNLVAFRLQMPVWLIVLLCALAMLAAILFGHFHSRRLVHGLAKIEEDVDRLASSGGRGGERLDNFVELRRLHARVARALSSLVRERDGLRVLAYRHPVTGLPNLGALQDRLEMLLQGADYDAPVCYMLLDLDRFGRACEMLGAGPGNELLREAARRMEVELAKICKTGIIHSSEAMLAHFHSDDFGIVLSGITSRKDASSVARAMRAAFVRPFDLDGRRISLGLSGGIVIAPEDGDHADDLMRRASIAHSSLREEGRTGFRFFTPRLDRVAKGRMQLETEMRRGLAQGEFEPFFQPKIDFRTGRIAGCEALARWQRDGGRSVSPGAFIPVAEESGLIDEIGQTILERACEAAVGWLLEGLPMPVAVNVSPSQVAHEEFRDLVIGVLARTGLPPRLLELEITESVAVSDPKAFRNVMNPLKAMGVRLAIDDFGTGHSNLSILSRLNFDVFKIDRQFIAGLDGDDSAPAIVEMILAMAESLGLETVAEGIETPEQARFLRGRGCTLGQGFLYSRALPEAEFREFARKWNDRRAPRTQVQAS